MFHRVLGQEDNIRVYLPFLHRCFGLSAGQFECVLIGVVCNISGGSGVAFPDGCMVGDQSGAIVGSKVVPIGDRAIVFGGMWEYKRSVAVDMVHGVYLVYCHWVE